MVDHDDRRSYRSDPLTITHEAAVAPIFAGCPRRGRRATRVPADVRDGRRLVVYASDAPVARRDSRSAASDGIGGIDGAAGESGKRRGNGQGESHARWLSATATATGLRLVSSCAPLWVRLSCRAVAMGRRGALSAAVSLARTSGGYFALADNCAEPGLLPHRMLSGGV